jgi:hypothetical protein
VFVFSRPLALTATPRTNHAVDVEADGIGLMSVSLQTSWINPHTFMPQLQVGMSYTRGGVATAIYSVLADVSAPGRQHNGLNIPAE